jgi:hypothetical protein
VTANAGPKPGPKSRPRKRRFSNPAASYAKRLERYRPGIVEFVLDGLASIYGRETWERRLDPTSELILTILTQNSADTNAEVAFEALRRAYPSGLPAETHRPGSGWGGIGLSPGAPPDWAAVEFAPREPEGASSPGDASGDPGGTRRLLARIPGGDDAARRS